MAERATILFSGGGTGGHLLPGIAVAEALEKFVPDVRCVFAGSGRPIERQLAAAHGLEHHGLSIAPSTELRRHPLRFAWRYWNSRREAGRLIDTLRPNAVVGLGGFASVPVATTARSRGIPVILLEQNAVPGRATRWISKSSAVVCLSLEEAAEGLPRATTTHLTGNPVRNEIAMMHSRDRPNKEAAPTLLVLGGSQGASALNEAVPEAVSALHESMRGWRIVHQTGTGADDAVRERYRQVGIDAEVAPFYSDLATRLATATLVISRAGGTTLAEFACAGCPAILVPYPNAVGNHQWWNARAYEQGGGARIVEQTPSAAETSKRLADTLRELRFDPASLDRMADHMRKLAHPEAAEVVAKLLLERCGIRS